MKYDVSHKTIYDYGQPVSISHHVLHLMPRPCDHQECLTAGIKVTPEPTIRGSGADYFGNPVNYLTLQSQHSRLCLHAFSQIEVRTPAPPASESTPPWDGIFADLCRDTSDAGLETVQFAFDSPYTEAMTDLAAFARVSFTPGRPIMAAALDLTSRIFNEFAYDDSATTVSTPVDKVFADRRGVCQDFAHLELACLRALSLPARYVSGYLLTHPPEGQVKLAGADASHAWLSVWCPGHGWVDLDPTNNMVAGNEHITLAWGRDYGDVSPVNGAIFGGGDHTVDVEVDVTSRDDG